MAHKNRYINTHFWDDSYIVDLDPIEKLLFLYLLTSPLNNIAGCYEIQTRRIAFDTGIDKDMVAKILQRFERDEKVYYIEGHVLIINFTKHQKLNHNIVTGINKVIEELPDNIKTSKAFESLYKAFESLLRASNYLNLNLNLNSNLNKNNNSNVNMNAHRASDDMDTMPEAPDTREVVSFFVEKGAEEEEADLFYNYYNSQGWRKSNGQYITSWKSAAANWINKRENDPKFQRKNIFSGSI